MDLRRRNKQHVMETMDGKTPAPRAHEFACAHGDELLIQRVGAYCLASGYSSDCRLDLLKVEAATRRRSPSRSRIKLWPLSTALRPGRASPNSLASFRPTREIADKTGREHPARQVVEGQLDDARLHRLEAQDAFMRLDIAGHDNIAEVRPAIDPRKRVPKTISSGRGGNQNEPQDPNHHPPHRHHTHPVSGATINLPPFALAPGLQASPGR